MSKICQITGKTTQNGNNVSHARNRVHRLFHVNLQHKKFFWPEQNCWIDLRVSAKGIRTINKLGLNAALVKAANKGLL